MSQNCRTACSSCKRKGQIRTITFTAMDERLQTDRVTFLTISLTGDFCSFSQGAQEQGFCPPPPPPPSSRTFFVLPSIELLYWPLLDHHEYKTMKEKASASPPQWGPVVQVVCVPLSERKGCGLPYCYYILRVLYFANFCDSQKIAKWSTRKNF